MSLAECGSGVLPYYVAASSAYDAETAEGACYLLASGTAGHTLQAYGGGFCALRDVSTGAIQATPVLKRCELPAPHWSEVTAGGLSAVKVADYMSLWSAFLVAGVVVLCARALYQKFRVDHES